MKSAHSLVILSVLAALSLTSCGHDWSWGSGGYRRVQLGGNYYGSNFNGAPSFGGHGGGYGNGYSVWPQPTINYGENFTYDDDPSNVGNSWDHGTILPPQATVSAVSSRSVSQGSSRTTGK